MITAILAFMVAIMLLLVALDAGYFYKGHHRGKYVEDPAWMWTVQPDGSLIFNGPVTIAGGERQKAGNLWIEAKPDLGAKTLPPVWPFLADGSLRDLKEEGWHDLGTLATGG